jgi:hypothetical protein
MPVTDRFVLANKAVLAAQTVCRAAHLEYKSGRFSGVQEAGYIAQMREQLILYVVSFSDVEPFPSVGNAINA